MRTTINPNELVDIRDVQVDSNMSRNERISDFNRQIKDPHHYKCGNITITAKFPKNGASMEKCFESLILS